MTFSSAETLTDEELALDDGVAPTASPLPPAAINPSPAPRKLRPYQIEAVNAVNTSISQGVTRPVVVFATGLGKSTVAAKLAVEARARGERVFLLAHRGKLLDQMTEAIELIEPNGERVGRVQAGANDHTPAIVACAIQTLSRPKRLAAVSKPDLVIFDEVHHSGAETYYKVLDNLGVINGTTSAVGLTATFSREDDGKGHKLSHIWDEVVIERTMEWAIDHGYLVRPEGRRVVIPGLDLRGIRSTAGDLAAGQLGERMEEVNVSVAEVVRQHVPHRRSLVFAVTVSHAQHLAEELNVLGIPAAAVWGQMPTADMEKAYDDFEHGRVRVLTTVALLTEGVDFPWCDCVVLARPTKSKVLLVQMVGRAVRLHPGKLNALVIDLCSAIPREGVVSASEVLGEEYVSEYEPDGSISEPAEPKDQFDLDDAGEEEEYRGLTGLKDIDILHGDSEKKLSPAQMRKRLREQEKQRRLENARAELADPNNFVWVTSPRGAWLIPANSPSKAAVILLPGSSPATARTVLLNDKGNTLKLLTDTSGYVEELPIDQARSLAASRMPDGKHPMREGTSARMASYLPPSDSQTTFAKNLGVWREGMTRIQCSDAINGGRIDRSLRKAGISISPPQGGAPIPATDAVNSTWKPLSVTEAAARMAEQKETASSSSRTWTPLTVEEAKRRLQHS